jgi:hypothetical protein
MLETKVENVACVAEVASARTVKLATWLLFGTAAPSTLASRRTWSRRPGRQTLSGASRQEDAMGIEDRVGHLKDPYDERKIEGWSTRPTFTTGCEVMIRTSYC